LKNGKFPAVARVEYYRDSKKSGDKLNIVVDRVINAIGPNQSITKVRKNLLIKNLLRK
jgi:hypothetical protein